MGRFAGERILPELERIAHKDKYRYVRRAAQEAIKQIRWRASSAGGTGAGIREKQ